MDSVRWDADDQYKEIISAVSKKNLFTQVQNIARYSRESGTEGERQALDYIQDVLHGYGIATELLEFDSFVGLPENGEVTILHTEGEAIQGRPPAFSAQTPEDGIEAAVVHVNRGSPEDLEGTDVTGKIALVDGLASPQLCWFLEGRGALGIICISGENIHDMIISSVWGTPTPETAWRVPKVYVLTITGKDGDRIKSCLKNGGVDVRMKVNAFLGWKKIPILMAHVDGTIEPGRYIILSGHIDSWHYGATDNGTANATMIEIARIMNLNRQRLRRGVKLGFWSGHSHGRYSGSAWYADNYWEQLYRHCVGVVTVDIVGCKGSTDYTKFPRLGITKTCGSKAVLEATGQHGEGAPFGRAGDQSFWGIGIPSMFGAMSRPPQNESEISKSLQALVGHTGFPWWWHTVHDTIDKVDPDIMVAATKIAALAVWYFCANTFLPVDFTAGAREIVDLLSDLKQRAGGRFSLDSTIHMAEDFLKSATELHGAVSGMDTVEKRKIDLVNQALIDLAHLIVPVVQTATSRFDHDLAMPMKRLPALQPVAELGALDESSDAARFLETRLVRERNRVEHALLGAKAVVDAVLAKIQAS